MNEKIIGLFIFAISTQVSSTSFLGRYLFPFSLGKRSRDKNKLKNSDLYLPEDSWSSILSLDEDGDQCYLEVINDYNETFLVCWVDVDGSLHHYYPVNDGSIRDGSVSNKHTECTHVGHSFVLFRPSRALPKFLADVRDEDFICLYRPQLGLHRHELKISKLERNKSIRGRDNRTYMSSVFASVEVYQMEDEGN